MNWRARREHDDESFLLDRGRACNVRRRAAQPYAMRASGGPHQGTHHLARGGRNGWLAGVVGGLVHPGFGFVLRGSRTTHGARAPAMGRAVPVALGAHGADPDTCPARSGQLQQALASDPRRPCTAGWRTVFRALRIGHGRGHPVDSVHRTAAGRRTGVRADAAHARHRHSVRRHRPGHGPAVRAAAAAPFLVAAPAAGRRVDRGGSAQFRLAAARGRAVLHAKPAAGVAGQGAVASLARRAGGVGPVRRDAYPRPAQPVGGGARGGAGAGACLLRLRGLALGGTGHAVATASRRRRGADLRATQAGAGRVHRGMVPELQGHGRHGLP